VTKIKQLKKYFVAICLPKAMIQHNNQPKIAMSNGEDKVEEIQ
jgi:hypothetical protein